MYSIAVSASPTRSAPQSARPFDRMAGRFATHPPDRLAAHA